MQSREIPLVELIRLAMSCAEGIEARSALRRYREIKTAGGQPVIEVTTPHEFLVYDRIDHNYLLKIVSR